MPDDLPDDVPLPPDTPITRVLQNEGHISIKATKGTTIDAALEEMVQVVVDEGFEVLSTENDGIDAEIFFSRANEVAGVVRLTLRGPCEGDVGYNVIYDPLDA